MNSLLSQKKRRTLEWFKLKKKRKVKKEKEHKWFSSILSIKN
jgi:hypothetical protein